MDKLNHSTIKTLWPSKSTSERVKKQVTIWDISTHAWQRISILKIHTNAYKLIGKRWIPHLKQRQKLWRGKTQKRNEELLNTWKVLGLTSYQDSRQWDVTVHPPLAPIKVSHDSKCCLEQKELSNTAVPEWVDETNLGNNLLGVRSNTCISYKLITQPLLTFKNDHFMWADLSDILGDLSHCLIGRHVEDYSQLYCLWQLWRENALNLCVHWQHDGYAYWGALCNGRLDQWKWWTCSQHRSGKNTVYAKAK